jgi:hypothetical protein
MGPGPTGEQVEQVRRGLRVSANRTSDARFGIAISYADRDPDRTLGIVNALAKWYAKEHRTKEHRTKVGPGGRQEYVRAQQAAERARQEYFDAKGRFDDFIDQHFLKQQSLADRTAKWKHALPSARDSTGDREDAFPAHRDRQVTPRLVTPGPGQIERERELAQVERQLDELQRQLAELEERRASLLVSRTPLHPAVQDVDARIAGLKERLASIRAQAPVQPSSVPAVPEPPAPTSAASTPAGPTNAARTIAGSKQLSGTCGEVLINAMADELAEELEAFRGLQEAVDLAREKYDRLAEIKRRAWEAGRARPSIELELAEACEACPPAHGSPRSVLVALASALAVAFGVGLIWTGFDVDPPLASLAEAEASLPVPVVGAIPEAGWASDGASKRHSQRAGRLATIIYGVLVIVVCLGILVALF